MWTLSPQLCTTACETLDNSLGSHFAKMVENLGVVAQKRVKEVLRVAVLQSSPHPFLQMTLVALE